MDISRSLSLLKRATWYEVVYLSIILLPLPLFAWTRILDWLELSAEGRTIWICVLIFIQIIGIFLFVAGASAYRRKLNTLTMVMGYLQDKNFKMVSFEKIREKYGPKYTDEYLNSLIQTFPDQIRFAVLSEERPGIARLEAPVDLKESKKEGAGVAE